MLESVPQRRIANRGRPQATRTAASQNISHHLCFNIFARHMGPQKGENESGCSEQRPFFGPVASRGPMTNDNHKPIVLRSVSYQVGDALLAGGVSFEVGPAETVVLLGRSGSGKTTVLRLINRLLTPTSGEVHVEGRSTTAWDPIRLRRRIGYVIQEVGLFPHFTVERNIGLVPSLEGQPPETIRRRTEELLQKVGLPQSLLARYPDQLSGGQRQRVGVARALAADPPILLMDEPFGALDPITRAEIQREFLSIQEALGKAIVFVTHDVREALLLGHRIGVMESGRLIWSGTPSEFRSSSDPSVAAFREGLT